MLGKEETLDKKLDALEKRESKLNSREANFEKEKEKVAELRQSHLRELEKISGLTSEQAKEYLLKTVEEDVKHETAVLVKELERQAKDEANKRQKIMWLRQFRSVLLTMYLRQRFLLCHCQAMK